MEPTLAQIAQDAYNEKRQARYGDLMLDPDLSTPETSVYRNPLTRQLVIGSRGTKIAPKSLLSDLHSDVQLALGSDPTERLARAASTVDAARAKYAGDSLTFTGHSLGGTLSARLAERYPDSEATTYNRGAGLPTMGDLKCKIGGVFGAAPKYCGRINNYRIRGDGASLLGRAFGSGNWSTRPGQGSMLDRHAASNFAR